MEDWRGCRPERGLREGAQAREVVRDAASGILVRGYWSRRGCRPERGLRERAQAREVVRDAASLGYIVVRDKVALEASPLKTPCLLPRHPVDHSNPRSVCMQYETTNEQSMRAPQHEDDD